jgi:hypothetical protein
MKAKGVLLEYHLGPGIVKLQLMSDYRHEFNAHWMKNKTAVQEFDFSRWYKKKSTGRDSQNNACWGYSRQIAQEIGDDPREILREACLRTPEYPSTVNKLGVMVPMSWSEANTKQASAVRETLLRIADFLGMRLEEGDWGE